MKNKKISVLGLILLAAGICGTCFAAEDHNTVVLARDAVIAGRLNENGGDFVLSFTVDNREEMANIKILSGDIVLTAVPEIKSKAPGFWSFAPSAKIKVDNGILLEIAGKGQVDVKIFFSAAAEEKGSKRTLELAFPDLAGSCTGTVTGAENNIVNINTANAVSYDTGSMAWPLGKTSFSWQVLSDDNETGNESIQRFRGDIHLSAGAESAVMLLNADGEVTAGSVSGSLWHIPSGWTPVKVSSSAGVKDWNFDNAENTLMIEYASAVSGEYDLDLELVHHPAGFPAEISVAAPDPGTVNFNTKWVFSAAEGMVWECLEPGDLVRIAEPLSAVPFVVPEEGDLQYYAGYGRGGEAIFRLSISEPVITTESFIRITLGQERFTAKGDFKVNVREAGVRQLQLCCDKEWIFQEIISADALKPEVSILPYPEDRNKHLLNISFPYAFTGEQEFSVLWERVPVFGREFVSGSFFIAGASGRGYAALLADPAVLAGVPVISGAAAIPFDALPVRCSNAVAAGIIRDNEWQVTANPVPAPRKVNGEIFNLYAVDEARIRGMALFTLDCSGAPFENMLFQFPETCGNIEFTLPDGLRASAVVDVPGAPEGFIRKRLVFSGKITGTITLLASFEISGGTGTEFTTGGISIIEEGTVSAVFAAVTGDDLMEAEAVVIADGAAVIMPEELPAEYAGLVSGRILQAWSLEDGGCGGCCVKAAEKVEMLPAIIEKADYVCRLSAGGEYIIEGKYTLKNISSQFLRLSLPEGTAIWQLAVNGTSTAPAADGGSLLIPLPLPESAHIPVNVAFTAAVRLSAPVQGEYELPLPVSDIPVIKRTVTVELPEELAAVPPGGFEAEADFMPGFEAWFSPLVKPLTDKLILLWWIAAGNLAAGLTAAATFACRKKIPGIIAVIAFVVCSCAGIAGLCRIADTKENIEYVPALQQRIVFDSAADFGVAGDSAVIYIGGAEPTAAAGMFFCIAGGIMAIAAVILLALKHRLSGSLLLSGCIFVLLYGASQSVSGTVAGWLAVAAGVLFILPFLAGMAFYRWKKQAAIILVFTVSSVLMGAPIQIAEYSADLVWSGQALRAEYECIVTAEKDESIVVALPDTMLFAPALPEDIVLEQREDGYWLLKALDDYCGTVNYYHILPVADHGASRSAEVFFPAAARNKVAVEGEVPVIPGAVKTSLADGVFTAVMPSAGGSFTVTVRNAGEEQAVPAVSRTEEIIFAPGNFLRRISCTFLLHKGSTEKVMFNPGSGWQAIHVSAPGMDRWITDGEGNCIVYFAGPVSGEFTVSAEAVCRETAGEFTVGPTEIPGCTDNGGLLEFSAAAGKKITVTAADGAVKTTADTEDIRYRFSGSEALFILQVTDAVPHIRASVNIRTALQEERTDIECNYSLEVAEGTLFSRKIIIPEGYEVIDVTTSVPSQWRTDGRIISVEFEKPLRNAGCDIICHFAAAGGTVSGSFAVPYPVLEGVDTLSGFVEVVAGKGMMLSVGERSGLAYPEISADGRHVRCRILSKDWQLETACVTAAPWISAELRSIVNLKPSAGEVTCTANILVENNFIRSLLVKLPSGISGYSFAGNDISRVVELGDDLVRIEFSRRIEGGYLLVCRMNLPAGEDFMLEPLYFPEAAGTVAGTLAVTVSGGELLPSVPEGGGINAMDQREFGPAGAASGLPLEAWSTSGDDWKLHCKIVKNTAVETNRITLKDMNIFSYITAAGAETVKIEASVFCSGGGNLIFRLPAGAVFLAAGFNGTPASPVWNGENMMLAANDGTSRFFLEYALIHELPAQGGEFTLAAPAFAAPVTGVCWRIGGENGLRAEYVSGTLNRRSVTSAILSYEAEDHYMPAAPAGAVARSDLRLMNSYYENCLLYSSVPAEKSDIYGTMLEMNTVSNAGNIQARQAVIAGTVSGSGTSVDDVAGKIFSIQRNARVAPPLLRAVLPENQGVFMQLESVMFTEPFAPVTVTLRRSGPDVSSFPLAGIIFTAAAGLITGGIIALGCRKKRDCNE